MINLRTEAELRWKYLSQRSSEQIEQLQEIFEGTMVQENYWLNI